MTWHKISNKIDPGINEVLSLFTFRQPGEPICDSQQVYLSSHPFEFGNDPLQHS